MTNGKAGDELANILAAIQRLRPEERRSLVRRLRAAGLLDNDELLSDRNRLRVAPALGLAARRIRRRVEGNRTAAKPLPANFIAPKTEPLKPDAYRSPVSGKVVVGPPSADAPPEPHTMSPLPGQAPEQPIVVIFDGGSRGNPGQGYGSYALRWPGQPEQVVRLRFGDRVTNNEAEYDTLIAAIEAILQRLADAGAAPATARVEIRGDSLLVVNQVTGQWEAKEPRLQLRRDRARDLLERFGQWQLIHHPREHSVQSLGH
jgi:ribonuclease HI